MYELFSIFPRNVREVFLCVSIEMIIHLADDEEMRNILERIALNRPYELKNPNELGDSISNFLIENEDEASLLFRIILESYSLSTRYNVLGLDIIRDTAHIWSSVYGKNYEKIFYISDRDLPGMPSSSLYLDPKFYKTWWNLCKCKLAIADASTAELE